MVDGSLKFETPIPTEHNRLHPITADLKTCG